MDTYFQTTLLIDITREMGKTCQNRRKNINEFHCTGRLLYCNTDAADTNTELVNCITIQCKASAAQSVRHHMHGE